MPKELEKIYNPKNTEDRIYNMWRDKNCFTPCENSEASPFCIVIPPPNVTGQLHMGHALDCTLQDIIIRTKRMQGYSALWVPGTDHAGIATQIRVEEMLRKEGKTRHMLGREAFIEKVWEWKKLYGGKIITQLQKLGASCDWSRERFTMDETLSMAVKKVFVSLYNKDLIYRGYRIINRCPACATALSDTEVEYKEQQGYLWHIKYNVENSDESLVIATTRPETMLGDTAVAVHPEDERYSHLVGKNVILPLMGRTIPIIADSYVDMDFGTGCVKITPCHDPNDYEVSERHDIERILVIDESAKMNENSGKYQGLERYEARAAIVRDLEEQGLLVKKEEHTHNVGTCYRCGNNIEPMTSRQWFVKMEPLAGPAIEVVKNNSIEYIPERFAKIYINWMENIHDWCISRQLWWGHRIPAFYCDDCGEISVSEDNLSTCQKCGSSNIHQDEDVLDTWFSSALWPFSTLGWPEKTADLERYYPTSVLVTGYDIITFWVSKMIFMGLECIGEKPFSSVFIHGLVRDEHGRKMSKSLGNGIDPLDIIDEYGADALRFMLVTGNTPGNDMRFSDKKVEAARNFCNKIWNASRFVLMNLEKDTKASLPQSLNLEDKWILSLLNETIRDISANIENYELGVASAKLYEFIWDYFCDWYIELVKPRLFLKDTQDNKNSQQVIAYVLSETLKLLHPFMPFLSEEIWQTLALSDTPLIQSDWSCFSDTLDFPEEQKTMDRIITAIRAIRNRRAEMNIPPSKKAKLFVVSAYKDSFNSTTAVFFERLAGCSEVEFVEMYEEDGAVSVATDSAMMFIPMHEIIDIGAEKIRLEREKQNVIAEIERIEKKLGNESFVAKAPAAVVDGEKQKLLGYEEKLQNVNELIEKLL